VEIATNTENEQGFSEELKHVNVHHIPFSRSLLDKSNCRAIFEARQLLKQNKYDVIHVHTPIASFISRLAAPKMTKKVYTAHGFHFNENGRIFTNYLFWAAEKIAGFKTDKLIVINKEDVTAARKIVPGNKIEYVKGVGIDTDQYHPSIFADDKKSNLKNELDIPADHKVITHIAGFNDNKRQIDVVNACKILKQKYEAFTILLVGTGPTLNHIKQEIKNKNLEDHIKCIGYRKDIDKILSITDVGLLVSLREGLPRSVMEMMAMKVPVVLSDIRGNRDLVENNKNGFLVPAKNPDKIAEKCFTLLTNVKSANQFSERSYQIILNEFSLKPILKRMDSVYKDLLN
jgi:glycosyltransferase involved in cell wall biosynthesis